MPSAPPSDATAAPVTAGDAVREGAARGRWGRGELVLAAVVLGHLVLLALVLTRHLDALFNDAMHRLGPGTDFAAYRAAGAAWRAGEGLYGRGPGFGFRYHPAFAMTIGAGLSLLGAKAAYAVWVVLHEALLLLDLALLRRLVPERRRFFPAAVVLLLFSPYFLEVYMGNASFIVASLLLVAFFCHETGRTVAFVALFAASLLVKPLGLIFVPLLLLRRQLVAVGVALGLVVILGVPYFLGHPGEWGTLVAINLHGAAAPGWALHAGNQGLEGLLTLLCVRGSGLSAATYASAAQLPGVCRSALVAVPLTLLGVTLVASWRARRNLAVGIFLWSALYLLGYRDVWEHSYSFLVLGLAYLWARGAVAPRLVAVCAVGLALPTAFALYDPALPPGPNDPERHLGLATALLHHATKPGWLVALYVGCVAAAWRRRVAQTGPATAAAAGSRRAAAAGSEVAAAAGSETGAGPRRRRERRRRRR